jgi:hypothetical protein
MAGSWSKMRAEEMVREDVRALRKRAERIDAARIKKMVASRRHQERLLGHTGKWNFSTIFFTIFFYQLSVRDKEKRLNGGGDKDKF